MMTISDPPPSPPAVGSSKHSSGAHEAPLVGAPILRVLRAVFWKEFRQNRMAAFAVLMLVGLITLLVGGVYYFAGEDRTYWWGSGFLLLQVAEPWIMVGCPIVGLMLGTLQPGFDRPFDLWAFLMHRPVSRATLFFGRALAGLALYGIAAGVPLAILFIVSAVGLGGHFFHWRFMLPPISDFCVGIVYYFAGLLVTGREASIFGSRLIPICMAVLCSVAAFFVPGFWQAILICTAVAGTFMLAAIGAHLSHGYALRAPRITRVATFVVLFISFSAIFVMLEIPLHEMNLTLARDAATKFPYRIDEINRTVTTHFLLPDGDVVKCNYSTPHPDGEPVDPKRYSFTRVTGQGSALDPATVLEARKQPLGRITFTGPFPQPQNQYHQLELMVERTVLEERQYSSQIKERWFYVPTAGRFYGYDHATRAFIGTLDAGGFSATGASPQPAYPIQGLNVNPLQSERGLFNVYLKERKLEPIMHFPSGARILQTAVNWYVDSGNARVNWNFALTPDLLLVYSRTSPDLRLALPLAKSPAKYILTVTRIEDRNRWVLWYSPLRPLPREKDTVEIFDDAGHRLEHAEFVALQIDPPPVWPPPVHAEIIQNCQMADGVVDALTNMPAQALLGTIVQTRNSLSENLYGVWHDRYGLPDRRAYLGAAAVTLAIAGLAMWLLARRYAVRFKWLWILSALVFGPMMLLLLGAMHWLPRLLSCPNCRKPRRPSDALCPSCQAPFPAPPNLPTNIFA